MHFGIIMMVVVLETRIEKRKKVRKQKRLAFFKVAIIMLLFALLYVRIKLVNDTIIYLGYIENPTIFDFDFKDRVLELFGERYFIDLKILKKVP